MPLKALQGKVLLYLRNGDHIRLKQSVDKLVNFAGEKGFSAEEIKKMLEEIFTTRRIIKGMIAATQHAREEIFLETVMELGVMEN
ncbi:hypothetical protein KKC32_03395 [Patescibacteria group bacterium]|nr:hypothetical protein [Patescibacteria group bacterium]